MVDERPGISILPNKDGWTKKDLEVLRKTLEPAMPVAEADDRYLQKADLVIPSLIITLGILFEPFFDSVLREAGKDAYSRFKKYVVEKSRAFEKIPNFKFHKLNFRGEYRGISVQVDVNSKKAEGVRRAADQFHEVMPLIDRLYEQHGAGNPHHVELIFSEARGRWVLNYLTLANGDTVRGEIYQDPPQI